MPACADLEDFTYDELTLALTAARWMHGPGIRVGSPAASLDGYREGGTHWTLIQDGRLVGSVTMRPCRDGDGTPRERFRLIA